MNVYQMLAYESMRTFFGPWLSLAFRIHSEGAENVPKDGGALMICNHRSILDPLALMTEVERYVHFVAGSHGFVVPMVKTFYHMTGMVRLSLKGGAGSAQGIDEAVDLLKSGELVGIFPEGIESFMRPDRSSKISYFRTGFARVALEAGTPIIPAAVIPREEVKLPPVPGKLVGSYVKHPAADEGPLRFMLYKKVLVRVGQPIDLSGFLDQPLTKTAIDTLSGKLRRIVIKLYNGEDLDRFLYGKLPFDIFTDRV
jgi:1-acyl-sn-glycerol-3-phosphate acyltransferase